jgi:hypothetical protein
MLVTCPAFLWTIRGHPQTIWEEPFVDNDDLFLGLIGFRLLVKFMVSQQSLFFRLLRI